MMVGNLVVGSRQQRNPPWATKGARAGRDPACPVRFVSTHGGLESPKGVRDVPSRSETIGLQSKGFSCL